MKFTIVSVVFCFLVLACGCTGSKERKLTELSHKLDGEWISDNYLKNIKLNKSIYLSRNYNTKLMGFILDSASLCTGSSVLKGFITHEGGYDSPITYEKSKGNFTGKFEDDPDKSSFELNYKADGLCEMYFPATKRTDRYRKVADLQTELRKILIAGQYKSDRPGPIIKFEPDGRFYNWKNYNYYELVYDFVEGINFDAIIFFNSGKGGNFGDGEMYKFEIAEDELRLQHVEPDWDTFEHKISNDAIVLTKIKY